MRLWLSILAVTAATSAMKATGPLMLANRQLPSAARGAVSLMAPVLLAALIVVELAGPHWGSLNWQQLLGVTASGVARALKVPMLAAVLCGVILTALLRLI